MAIISHVIPKARNCRAYSSPYAYEVCVPK